MRYLYFFKCFHLSSCITKVLAFVIYFICVRFEIFMVVKVQIVALDFDNVIFYQITV
jgi:hypothetical protein